MNLKVSLRAVRATVCAGLVLASAGVVTTVRAHGQSSSSQQSTAAPGTKPMAAPGTVAAHGTALEALAPNQIFKYDNKWDIYGGLTYANGQAGQNLPKHYNMGGGEVMGTYWLGPLWKVPSQRLGLALDYRIGAGTSPVLPQAAQFGLNRILVYQNILSGGAQYRLLRNRYVGIDLHALAGATHGTFDSAITGYPTTVPATPTTPGGPSAQIPTNDFVGVYNNHTSGWGAAGGSIDFNYTPKIAVRLQPDITFEHFGTETREFFGISMGFVYHMGKRQ